MNFNACIGVVLCALLTSVAHAAPSSEELIQICEQALSSGYVGKRAQICTWYVTPCDCDISQSNAMPRVCIPDTTPSKKLAQQVVELLRDLPEYRQKDGALAAAQVLSVVYPCEQPNVKN